MEQQEHSAGLDHMKLRNRKHFNAQEVFVGSIPLNDGGSVTGPNLYFRKKCYGSLRRRYTRMGLYPLTMKDSPLSGA